MKIKKGEIIHIKWVDSSSPTDVWLFEKEFDFEDNDGSMLMESIGYFIKKTKLSTYICQSRRENKKYGGSSLGRIFSIPNAAISNITILR